MTTFVVIFTNFFDFMKKILVAAATILSSVAAMAEGYQINSLSARQIGMGHTGIGMKLGSESMFFNPAGMAYMDKTIDLSASVTGIMPTCTATVDGNEYTTDNGVSTPIFVNAGFSIYPNLKAGLSFYTPYGSSINWTDNWPGAVLSQNVALKVFTVQPTISWAINKKLSIGVGAMVTWGTVDLNKGLVSAESADKVIDGMKALGMMPAATPSYGNTTPASVNLNGKSRLAVGVNVGVLYNPTDDWSVGVSYRSKMGMKVKSGDASVRYNGGALEQMLTGVLNSIHNSQFKAEMPCPWVLGFGASYTGIDRLTLAADARLTGWHAYQSLDVEFLDEQLTPMNQYITKNYKNSWCFSLGSQYAVTDRFDARLGLMIDTSPVNDEYYNPETPGMTKIEPTVGLSFRPIPSLSIDFGFMYIHGCGKNNASVTYDDMMYKGVAASYGPQTATMMGLTPQKTFTADYKLHAFSPSIGVSYKF